MKSTHGIRQDDIEAEVAGLTAKSRVDLEASWRTCFGCEPPKGVKRRFMERAIAYQLQAKAYGGLRSVVRKALGTATRDPSAISHKTIDNTPKPGTRLVREWNNRSHTVDVLEAGYLYNGQTYRSLSAIARTITGARWSGPRFFGL